MKTSSTKSALTIERGHSWVSSSGAGPATRAPRKLPMMYAANAAPVCNAIDPLCSLAAIPRKTMFPVMTLVNTPPRRRSPIASIEPVTTVSAMTRASRRFSWVQNPGCVLIVSSSTTSLRLGTAAEERLDEEWIVLEVARLSREDHATTTEYAGPVRDPQCRLGALFDEQNRRSVVSEATNVLLEQLRRYKWRQVGRRLVEDQD